MKSHTVCLILDHLLLLDDISTSPQVAEVMAQGSQEEDQCYSHTWGQSSSPTSYPHRSLGHLQWAEWKSWYFMYPLVTKFLVKTVPGTDVIPLGLGVTSQHKVTALSVDVLTTIWTQHFIVWSKTRDTFFVHSPDISWPLVHQNHHIVPIMSLPQEEVTNVSLKIEHLCLSHGFIVISNNGLILNCNAFAILCIRYL